MFNIKFTINEGVRRSAMCVVLSVSALLLGGCGSESETIVDGITDAENLFFTSKGRLFVSGGENIFEIVQ